MQSTIDFWTEVVTVWNTAVFGVGLGPIFIGLVIFVGFLVLRRLFTRVVLVALNGISRRTKTKFDDQLIVALEQPMRFVFVIIGLYAATRFVSLPTQVDGVMTQ